MVDKIIRLNVVALRTQLELAERYILVDREAELARRVLRKASADAAILAKNYPAEDIFSRVSSLSASVVDAPEIEMVNMIRDLLRVIASTS
jgi:hypothetical protein